MCDHSPFPKLAGSAKVLSNVEISPSIYSLAFSPEINANNTIQQSPVPQAGQFYMLRANPSGVLLGRPISVYLSDSSRIEFLILKKGRGTSELCALREGDSVDIVGPIGNSFMKPEEIRAKGYTLCDTPRIAVIGGGIGVAPVAGFALTLAPKTFDFYASFRNEAYGLGGLDAQAATVQITTEDGSSGTKGMLPSVFNASSYDLVYACGPTPMLRYIKEECAKAGTLAFISLEQRMACGAGACLGCTIPTTKGNKRCCVDGPVFDSAEVLL